MLLRRKVILHSLIASHYRVQNVNVQLCEQRGRVAQRRIDMRGDNTGVEEELFKTLRWGWGL